MDKDKLITFLTSDDEEIRKVGLEIIKNNFNCDFSVYYGYTKDSNKLYSLSYKDISFPLRPKKSVITALESELEMIFTFHRPGHVKQIVELIIEYNNEYRQNKGITTI